MKRILTVLLTLIFVVGLSVASFGLTSPSVTQGHGVVTGMFVSGQGNSGFLLGAEYGIIPNLAIGGEFGQNLTKIGVKYGLNPSVALMGGILSLSGGGNAYPYLGLDGGASINKDFSIIGEIDACSVEGSFVFLYEAGAKYNVVKQLDIRGGVRGAFGEGVNFGTAFELGVGFKF